MNNNPFAAVVGVIRQDNKAPSSYRFGIVTSTNPLTLDVAGNSHSADTLLKNVQLNGFVTGETLLVIPIEEEQRYIIICKVGEVTSA